MDLARRFAALLCIVVSLLVPAGAGPAFAAMDHVGQPDCPHAALVSPAVTASHPVPMVHAGLASHAMTMASGTVPAPKPAGLAALASCCNVLPISAPLAEPAPDLGSGLAASLPRPRSDAMPAQRAIGPDLPPPRA